MLVVVLLPRIAAELAVGDENTLSGFHGHDQAFTKWVTASYDPVDLSANASR